MKRRDFVKTGLLSGATVFTSLAGSNLAKAALSSASTLEEIAKYQFKLHYAPHFGMFENHAGKDLMDQLKFMADMGFTALEDNGMMARPVDMQEKNWQPAQQAGHENGRIRNRRG